jgi:hypothetical protein
MMLKIALMLALTTSAIAVDRMTSIGGFSGLDSGRGKLGEGVYFMLRGKEIRGKVKAIEQNYLVLNDDKGIVRIPRGDLPSDIAKRFPYRSPEEMAAEKKTVHESPLVSQVEYRIDVVTTNGFISRYQKRTAYNGYTGEFRKYFDKISCLIIGVDPSTLVNGTYWKGSVTNLGVQAGSVSGENFLLLQAQK